MAPSPAKTGLPQRQAAAPHASAPVEEDGVDRADRRGCAPPPGGPGRARTGTGRRPRKTSRPPRPRRASRGEASIRSVAPSSAAAKSHRTTASPVSRGLGGQEHRGQRAKSDRRRQACGECPPDPGGGDARVGERRLDGRERGVVDGAGAPPPAGGVAHLRDPIPRGRVGPHRSLIRRWARATSASAPAPRSADSRKTIAFRSRPNSSKRSWSSPR